MGVEGAIMRTRFVSNGPRWAYRSIIRVNGLRLDEGLSKLFVKYS